MTVVFLVISVIIKLESSHILKKTVGAANTNGHAIDGSRQGRSAKDRIEDISLRGAVLIEPLSIGTHAVGRAKIKQGDWCLVIGGGPIGLGV